MGTMILFMGIFGIAGISAGIKLSIWIQLAIIVLGVFYLNSSYVSSKELGALIDMSIANAMLIGMGIGNLIYLVFYWDRSTSGFSIKSILSFFFVP